MNTEHECFLTSYNFNLILLCSPKVYAHYKEFFKGKNITVVERDYANEFTDFYTVANTLRPLKPRYNANPEWSDITEVYLLWFEQQNGAFIIKYGDLDGFEEDYLVSIKPCKELDDGNHKIYDRLKRMLDVDYKIVYSN